MQGWTLRMASRKRQGGKTRQGNQRNGADAHGWDSTWARLYPCRRIKGRNFRFTACTKLLSSTFPIRPPKGEPDDERMGRVRRGLDRDHG